MKRESFNRDWTLNPLDGYEMFLNPDSVKPERKVTLPFDAMQLEQRKKEVPMGRNTGFYPSGQCTYVKKFTAPEEWRQKTVMLEFEGIYTHSMVYLNGDYVGGCPHGYTAFTVTADPFLKYGEENEIKVMAKTHLDSRWYPGMGIYRNVNLLVGELCHITIYGQKIVTLNTDESGANLLVEVELENKNYKNVSAFVTTTVSDASGKVVAKNSAPLTLYGNETEHLSQRLYVPDAKLWNVEKPYLYTVMTTVTEGEKLLDEVSCAFGIRSLSLDPEHGLRMNGKVLKLRGACVHHDNGLLGSAAIERAEERRVQLLKKAGFNAVRSAHNPISRAFLDACDKYGLVVMDELTDMWTQRKGDWDYSTSFPAHWPKLVESMVNKDFNHSSVILYSIGNEIHETGNAHGAKIGRRLARKLKELDPTRYTTNSVNLMMAGKGLLAAAATMGEGIGTQSLPACKDAPAMDINDLMTHLGPLMDKIMAGEELGKITEETFSCVDVAGYNYAASRYEMDRDRFPSRVIVGSETFPADIGKNWELVKKHSHVIGDFTWTGWDYLGEAGIGKCVYKEDDAKGNPEYPWYIAWCGDLDITGHRRPVSYYREIVFGLRTQPYLAVRYPRTFGKTRKTGGWDFMDGMSGWTWPGTEGKPVEVEVYAPGDRVELFLNGNKVAESKIKDYRTVLTTEYQPGTLTAVAYEKENEIGRFTLKTAGENVTLKAKPDRTVIRADETDLCYVDISLVDEAGIVNPSVDRRVQAKVEGAGVLAGLGSAKPTSEESFLNNSFCTFEGRLLAILRPTGEGTICLTLSTQGCPPVTIQVQAEKAPL